MLAVDLPKEAQERLEALAAQTGRSASSCAAQAILDFLESEEDCTVALTRAEKNRPGIPLEEVERKLGLES
jgi:RHH-type rel operon transcriptional repressor/antitoxin RelB